jgi:hypothetical protein
MKTWSERYPWHQHAAGESFFVSSLDVGLTLNQGLRVGKRILGKYARIRAQVGVYNGLLGVLFTVIPPRQHRDTSDSPPPASPQ